MSEQEMNLIIGKNLTKYLEKSGKSMSDLARYMDVSQTAVSSWCRGLKIPRMDKIDKMCQFFHCKRSDLMENSKIETTEDYSLSEDEKALIEVYRSEDPTYRKMMELIIFNYIENNK